MNHPSNADVHILTGIGAHAGEICNSVIKGVGHAHDLQMLTHLNIVLGFELGKGHDGLDMFRIREHFQQMFAGKAFDILRYGDTIIGKQGGKGVLSALIILDKAGGKVVFQVGIFLGMHHLHILPGTVLGGEITVPYLGLLVNLIPFSFKSQGVYQIHDGVLGNFVQDLRDHAVGMLLDPGIDVIQGTLVKGCLVDGCAVVIRIGLEEALLHFKSRVILEPDGVGKTHFARLIIGQQIHIRQHEAVQVFGIHAQNLLHLGQGLTVGTIGGHCQGIQDRQRRNQGVLSIFRCGLEQPHAEIRRSTCTCIHVRLDIQRFGRDILHQVECRLL